MPCTRLTPVLSAKVRHSPGNMVHRHPVDGPPLTPLSPGAPPHGGQSPHQPAHPVLQVGMARAGVGANQTWPAGEGKCVTATSQLLKHLHGSNSLQCAHNYIQGTNHQNQLVCTCIAGEPQAKGNCKYEGILKGL